MRLYHFAILAIVAIRSSNVIASSSEFSDSAKLECVSDDRGRRPWQFGYLSCSPVGGDGRKLGDLLQETQVYSKDQFTVPIKSSSGPTLYGLHPSAISRGSATDIAQQVRHLHLTIIGNLTITENCLENFTNMEIFNTNQYYNTSGDMWLDIAPATFRNKPLLYKIRLSQGFGLTKNTLLALEAVKDQIRDLEIFDCRAVENMAQVIGKFSNLERLNLNYIKYADEYECLEDMFQASANTIKSIEIYGCKPIDELTKGMFKNLGSLQELAVMRTKITRIEQGAFDDLVNLKRLYISYNNITKYLPAGLIN